MPADEPIARACPACAAPVTAGARFCGTCGQPIPIPAPPPIPRRRRTSDGGWGKVRSLLWFYVLYLASVLPLAWLPGEYTAMGMIIIGGVDLIIVLVARRQLGGAGLAGCGKTQPAGGEGGVSPPGQRASFGFPRENSDRRSPLGEAKAAGRGKTAFFRSLLETLRPAAVDRSGWMLALVAVLLLLPINLAYHWLITQALGLDDLAGLADPFERAGFGLAVQIAVVVIQPAVVEELAFRGILQPGLSRVVGHRDALLLTAFAFGIIHLAWLSLPYLILVGLALGWVRQRTGSLLPCMLLHALHNLAVLLYERAS